MGFLELFVAASIPVLNVLIVTGIGSFIATDYIGILHEDARKNLNNIVFYILNPALVLTNLGQTITMESFLLVWFMPINVFLTFLLGSVLGWIVNQITRAPRQLRGLIVGCCSAGNLGNLLLIIVPAICKEKASPFGDPDVCRTYGLAYASLSMALGAIFLWSYVYNIVQITVISSDPTIGIPDEQTKLTSGSSKPNYVDESGLQVPMLDDASAEKEVSLSTVRQMLSSVSSVINFKRLFAPSTIGVIIGFIIGLVPVIRNALIGESAPLRVIQDSASLLGGGAIPLVTLIMGGNLLKGLRQSDIHAPQIIGVVVVRYLFLPLMGIAVVKGSIWLGLIPANPLYQFVLLLQYCLPPAMNMGTITQLFGSGESECSVILLWTYSLASVAVTLWSTLFMWIVS